jgi:CDP-diacylglycerol--serine O-phosphatidyltransferase
MIFDAHAGDRADVEDDRGRPDRRRRRFRRGVYLLPSTFTLANMFCGYACVVHAMHGDYETAAPFIGFAIILDMLDGRIARLTRTATPFGLEFDSLADVISFGIAPAILTFSWGMSPLGRLGWAASFVFVTAAAMRLARFNIQGSPDKRYFAGMPAPAAAAVLASTVYAYPTRLESYSAALPVLALVLVPAFLMVSKLRFRSFKDVDLARPRSYTVLIVLAAALAAVTSHPRWVLVVLAYGYLLSAFVEWGMTRLRRRSASSPALLPAQAGNAEPTPPPQARE